MKCEFSFMFNYAGSKCQINILLYKADNTNHITIMRSNIKPLLLNFSGCRHTLVAHIAFPCRMFVRNKIFRDCTNGAIHEIGDGFY